MKQARENLEIRVVRAGKSWRVDCHEIGADTTRTASRHRDRTAAVMAAIDLAGAMRNLDYYGLVRIMAEI